MHATLPSMMMICTNVSARCQGAGEYYPKVIGSISDATPETWRSLSKLVLAFFVLRSEHTALSGIELRQRIAVVPGKPIARSRKTPKCEYKCTAGQMVEQALPHKLGTPTCELCCTIRTVFRAVGQGLAGPDRTGEFTR